TVSPKVAKLLDHREPTKPTKGRQTHGKTRSQRTNKRDARRNQSVHRRPADKRRNDNARHHGKMQSEVRNERQSNKGAARLYAAGWLRVFERLGRVWLARR